MEEKPASLEETAETPPMEPPPAEPPAPSLWEKLKANRFKILGGVLGILVFAGTVFGAYKFGQRQARPEPVEGPTPTPVVVATPTPDPTANWKTYTNTEYGFEFKYPKDWELKESLSKTAANNDWLFITLAKKEYMAPVPINLPHIQIHVVESTDPKQFSFYEWTNVVGSTTIDGIEAEVRQHKSADEKEVVFIRDGKTFEIKSVDYAKDDTQEKIFNLILSTFKFLEEATPLPIPTAKTINYRVIEGWTRYDNVSGGHSIQYNPAEYKIIDEDSSSPAHSIVDELRIPCITANCQTSIWIRIYSNYDGGSLQKWLEDVRGISRTERYLEDVIVENKKSLIAMDDRITEVAIPLSGRMVSIEMKGPFYNVTQKRPVNIEFVYQILSTFRFLD